MVKCQLQTPSLVCWSLILIEENRLEIGTMRLEIYVAPLDISVQPIYDWLLCCLGGKTLASHDDVSSGPKQMSGVPGSAYFLGHVVYAACSMIDMRRPFLTTFFQPRQAQVVIF